MDALPGQKAGSGLGTGMWRDGGQVPFNKRFSQDSGLGRTSWETLWVCAQLWRPPPSLLLRALRPGPPLREDGHSSPTEERGGKPRLLPTRG